MPCFYLPELNSKSLVYDIKGDEYHHICQVMRKKKGEELLLTSGNGILARAKIIDNNNKSVKIQVISTEKYNRSKPEIALAFALLKNKHDSMIIEKATELGCAEFFPMETDRTIRHSSSSLVDKFNKTAVAAIKQCDNAHLPRIRPCQKLKKLVDTLLREGYLPLIALEGECGDNLIGTLQKYSEKRLCILIGPEGGYSQSEKEYFREMGLTTFSLGNHILRAETAAVTAVGLMAGYYFYLKKDFY